MERVTRAELEAKIKQLNDAGADLSLSHRYNYYALENKSQCHTYTTGTKTEIARWLHGFASAFYRK